MAASSSSEPVKHTQKLVLRVPVDCEGCRKKVTKILHSISGVESCDVDIKQQRVGVTGNVDAGTLITKLVKKTGKHAELWPEPKVRRKKKSKEKRAQFEADEQRGPSDEAPMLNGDGESTEEGEGKEAIREDASQEEKKQQKAAEGGDPPPLPHAEALVNEVNMKKSKGRIGNENTQRHVETLPVDHSPTNTSLPRRKNPTTPAIFDGQHIPSQSASVPKFVLPRHPYPSASAPSHPAPRPSHYHPQSVYNAEPQPSWSASQPPRTAAPPSHQPPRPSYTYPQLQPVYTVSYSAAPRPQASQSAYVHRGLSSYGPHPPPNYHNSYRSYDDRVDYDGYGYRQQPESFGLFSDENPNACLIM